MEVQTLMEKAEDTFMEKKIEDSRPIDSVGMVYTLLAKSFSFPTDEVHRLFRNERIKEDMEEIMEGLPFELEFKGIPSISLSQDDIEILYTSYFDMPMCPCPLYESYHRKGDVVREDVREELLRFYEHFGVGPSEKNRDYPDHLSAELEFMTYLSRKESNAVKKGNDPTPYRLAQRDFLSKHLNRWLGKLDKVIKKLTQEKEPYFHGLSSFMVEFTKKHLSHLQKTLRH